MTTLAGPQGRSSRSSSPAADLNSGRDVGHDPRRSRIHAASDASRAEICGRRQAQRNDLVLASVSQLGPGATTRSSSTRM
jgi:hypothetical protein